MVYIYPKGFLKCQKAGRARATSNWTKGPHLVTLARKSDIQSIAKMAKQQLDDFDRDDDDDDDFFRYKIRRDLKKDPHHFYLVA